MTNDMRLLLKALYNYGYRYLARDPDDRNLYAYQKKPYLDDGCYVLPEENYVCLLLTPGGIDMFINDHDIAELYHADPKALAKLPVDAMAEPVELASLL